MSKERGTILIDHHKNLNDSLPVILAKKKRNRNVKIFVGDPRCILVCFSERGYRVAEKKNCVDVTESAFKRVEKIGEQPRISKPIYRPAIHHFIDG